MRKAVPILMSILTGVAVAQSTARASSQAGTGANQPVRPVGVVTQIKTGNLTLKTDAGPVLEVPLPEGISVLRVPPGAKDLKTATPITVGDIKAGDRILVRGRVSEDQKSVAATTVIVMARTDVEKLHEAERAEWRRRGIGGRVKSLDPAAKEVIITVPTRPPDPANPTRPVTITLAPNAELLRYAPDSVEFSDAKPGTFEEIRVGDQIRALGTRSEDGSHFTAEKLISGTFRNIGATVISVDAQHSAVTVKDLASGNAVVVRTNSDSKLHRLPPNVAQMLAGFTTAAGPNGGPGGSRGAGGVSGSAQGGPQGGEGGAWRREGSAPSRTAAPGEHPAASGAPPGMRPGNGGPPDFQEMIDRTPPLSISELKPGDALMVLSTQGTNPAEVTAIIVLAGVEPILAAQPKGSEDMVLGQWNMGGGGGEGGP